MGIPLARSVSSLSNVCISRSLTCCSSCAIRYSRGLPRTWPSSSWASRRGEPESPIKVAVARFRVSPMVGTSNQHVRVNVQMFDGVVFVEPPRFTARMGHVLEVRDPGVGCPYLAARPGADPEAVIKDSAHYPTMTDGNDRLLRMLLDHLLDEGSDTNAKVHDALAALGLCHAGKGALSRLKGVPIRP